MKEQAPIRTIESLRLHLEKCQISPEVFASQTNISNMTIRRLLARPSQSKIPPRYHAQLDRLVQTKNHHPMVHPPPEETRLIFRYLRNLASQEPAEKPTNLLSAARKYIPTCNLAQIIRPLIHRVGHAALHARSASQRALAIGALVYFITPLDFIPDLTAITGFLDDFALLSLVDMWLETQNMDLVT